MDIDTLFLETMSDLRRRVTAATEYDTQQAAALLRKLLLDGRPLVDAVNRTRQKRVTFRICDGSPFQDMALSLGPVFWEFQDAFDPDTVLVANPRLVEVDRKALLGRDIVLMNGVWFSVAEIIKYVSHVEGGVHRGTPADERQRLLAESPIRIGGHDSPVSRSLLAVARVVARGLEPLEEQIRSDQASGPAH